MKPVGLWLPIVTPFYNGEIDYESYKRLIDFYIEKGISGLIPDGTTGECPTVSEREFEELLNRTLEYVYNRVPIYFGLGGNYTNKVVKQLKTIERYKNLEGILSVCPYYNRPDQRGIYEHFRKISESTELNIIVYNIPYRTGRNIENETVLKLAELKNVVAVKDSCGDIKQTMELVAACPQDFSILTGEDILFYLHLVLGAEGGILAASHIATRDFLSMYDSIQSNDHRAALKIWKRISRFIPYLFRAPNPGPIKYYLKKRGMIRSNEVRRPLVEVSEEYEAELDEVLRDY